MGAQREVDYLLVGGGLAAANCAHWLREEGADGDVLLVGREFDAPYNRPECSKGYLRGEETREEPLFRPAQWWQEQRIDLLTRTTVTSLDLAARTAKLSNRDEVRFGQALIATGADVRRLDLEGDALEGIHYLRTLRNADAIREDVKDAAEVVLVGGSYIGCEVAASLTMMGHRCSIVMQERHTLERSFGAVAGEFFQRLLEEHGVRVHHSDELVRLEGDGRVSKVHTRAGLQLRADAVVIGAGVTPEVALARHAGLEIGPAGGVRCDSRLRSSAESVFSAGDICEYESVIRGGEHIRIEHWDVAFNQGKTAALNMLGRDVPHDVVPYFYSVFADWGELEYVGPATKWDLEILRGSHHDGPWTRWYLLEERLVAALTWGRPDDLEPARRLLSERPRLDAPARAALADPLSDLATVGSAAQEPSG
jgi:3-phenylpropionate/trans-cinnamate dioxygenase ferredoxin reductase component